MIDLLVALEERIHASVESNPPPQSSLALTLVDSCHDVALEEMPVETVANVPLVLAADQPRNDFAQTDTSVNTTIATAPTVEKAAACVVVAPSPSAFTTGAAAPLTVESRPSTVTSSNPLQLRKVLITGNMSVHTNPRMWVHV
jgi:hypothetical protein